MVKVGARNLAYPAVIWSVPMGSARRRARQGVTASAVFVSPPVSAVLPMTFVISWKNRSVASRRLSTRVTRVVRPGTDAATALWTADPDHSAAVTTRPCFAPAPMGGSTIPAFRRAAIPVSMALSPIVNMSATVISSATGPAVEVPASMRDRVAPVAKPEPNARVERALRWALRVRRLATALTLVVRPINPARGLKSVDRPRGADRKEPVALIID